jgi:4-hydroxybenzoate polyprenyltransferase/phosphoserine phosphatase
LSAIPTAEALVVDLDGTLVRTDTLHEQSLVLLKRRPWVLVRAALALVTRGRAALKDVLAAAVTLEPSTLPYRDGVLAAVRAHKLAGGRTVLASAAAAPVVEGIAGYLGLFDTVIASSPRENLKGERKLAAIRAALGATPFVYVGDSRADLDVWRGASRAVVVSSSGTLARKARALGVPVDVVVEKRSRVRLLAKQLRLHQWVKNALLLVPMLAAHKLSDQTAVGAAVLAAVAFSFLASSVYVFNDMVDLESDRRHHAKRNRPLASGALPLAWAFLTLPLLIGGAAAIAAGLPVRFAAWLGIYVVLNLAYSFRIKEVMILDVMVLTSFYGIRILAGGAATMIPVSHWLMSFGIFFFFSLAMLKRQTEIARTSARGVDAVHGRGYRADDRLPIFVMGLGAALLSILVLTLYFQSDAVVRQYARPDRLWMLVPLLLYWHGRIWMLAWRGEMHDDPVEFAVKDRVSWLVAALFAGVLALAG